MHTQTVRTARVTERQSRSHSVFAPSRLRGSIRRPSYRENFALILLNSQLANLTFYAKTARKGWQRT